MGSANDAIKLLKTNVAKLEKESGKTNDIVITDNIDLKDVVLIAHNFNVRLADLFIED